MLPLIIKGDNLPLPVMQSNDLHFLFVLRNVLNLLKITFLKVSEKLLLKKK